MRSWRISGLGALAVLAIAVGACSSTADPRDDRRSDSSDSQADASVQTAGERADDQGEGREAASVASDAPEAPPKPIDDIPPTLTLPDPLVVEIETDGPIPATTASIAAFLSAAAAVDAVDGKIPVSHNAPSTFPIGTVDVLFTATDAAGNRAREAVSVTVVGLPVESRQDFEGTGDHVLPVELQSGLALFELSHFGTSNFIVQLRGQNDEGLVNAIGDYRGTTAAHVSGGPFVVDLAADGFWRLSIREPRRQRPIELGSGYSCQQFGPDTTAALIEIISASALGAPTGPSEPVSAEFATAAAITVRILSEAFALGLGLTAAEIEAIQTLTDDAPRWDPGPIDEPFEDGGTPVVAFACTGDNVTPLLELGGLYAVSALHEGRSNFAVWVITEDGRRETLIFNEIGEFFGTTTVRLEPGRYRLEAIADNAWGVQLALVDG